MANIENKDHKKEFKKRFVKALYSYVPVNGDELALKVHDILEVIEETEEGWWKGILEGNVGMFPSNFVIELDGHPEEFNNKLMNELSPTKNIIKAKNVNQQEPMHRLGNNFMQTNKENVKQTSVNSNNNEVDGTTSSKYTPEMPLDKKVSTPVKKAVDSTAPELPPKPVREQARALFPYEAQNEDELTLKEGDIITVISKEVEDKGWWRGELNNKVGVFPDNFVKVIKSEEQRKPERPDKPSGALSSKISLRVHGLESNSDSSPKSNKKVIKTPPAKPPPPDIHKKEQERPLPPCPSKKPQPPHPVKKPTRISIGVKLPGFQSPAPAAPNLKSPISESNPPLPTYPPPSSEKNEESKKVHESTPEKKVSDEKKGELEFDAVESSGKKLVHLTANRAKAPNRRPPSYVFLKESEKDGSISTTDVRRRSEPLLAEMESLFSSNIIKDKEPVKTSTVTNIEKKPKVPPPRPFLPIGAKTSITSKNFIGLTKGSSSFDESIMKTEEEKKDILSEPIPPDVTQVLPKEVIIPHKPELLSDVKLVTTESMSQSKLEDSNISVSKKEFNELLTQVKELKENLDVHVTLSNKAISDLKVQLEDEKRLRLALEVEIQKLKENQTI